MKQAHLKLMDMTGNQMYENKLWRSVENGREERRKLLLILCAAAHCDVRVNE